MYTYFSLTMTACDPREKMASLARVRQAYKRIQHESEKHRKIRATTALDDSIEIAVETTDQDKTTMLPANTNSANKPK